MYHCQIFTRKCMLLKGTIVHHPLLCLVLCVELLYHVLHFAAAPLESLKTVLCSKMSGLHCSALLCQLCITMSISMQCAMNQSCMLCSVPKRWDSGAVHTAADREVKEEGGRAEATKKHVGSFVYSWSPAKKYVTAFWPGKYLSCLIQQFSANCFSTYDRAPGANKRKLQNSPKSTEKNCDERWK